MPIMTISIPEPLMEFVRKQKIKKGFGNVSEYFRALLRDEQERAAGEKIEAALLKGLESGADTKLTREFWKDLKVEAVDLLKKPYKVSS